MFLELVASCKCVYKVIGQLVETEKEKVQGGAKKQIFLLEI